MTCRNASLCVAIFVVCTCSICMSQHQLLYVLNILKSWNSWLVSNWNLIILDISSCLASIMTILTYSCLEFQDFDFVSKNLVSRITCLDPTLSWKAHFFISNEQTSNIENSMANYWITESSFQILNWIVKSRISSELEALLY